MPSLLQLPSGCAFAPRCGRASAVCTSAPPEVTHPREDAHAVRCFHPGPAASGTGVAA
jgi:peptide/nickel transport system ATP-binding protein